MITYSNIQRFVDMPPQVYFALSEIEQDKFFSHSFLKNEKQGFAQKIDPTEKMKLGSLVDKILTESDKITGEEINSKIFKPACVIASKIKKKFGDLIKNFEPQISYAGQADFKGIKLNVCGRLDWELPELAVIDLKITDAKSDAEFLKIVKHFGYDNQMFNYCGLSSTKQAFLMPYSTKANACLSIVKFEYSISANEFWQEKILLHGK